MARHKPTLDESFWRRVDKSGDCWVWIGNRSRSYGVLYLAPHKYVRAHRLSWQLHHGEIPAGMVVCHRCDNPLCVRPSHLFIGTQADNVRDMDAKGRGGRKFKGGRAHGAAKMTVEQVHQIRQRYDAKMRRADIAREFGIGLGTVEKIGSGATWAHLPRRGAEQ